MKKMGWMILGIVFIIVLGSLLKGVKPRSLFIVILSSFWISTFTIARKILAGTMDSGIGVLVVVVLVIFLIVWLVKSMLLVSTVKVTDSEGEEHEVATQVIVTRLGKPIRAYIPGLYWQWWPLDRVKRFIPTWNYKLEIGEFEVHSKAEKKGESAKPIIVKVTVHMNFPDASEKKGRYDLAEKPTELSEEEIPRPWKDILKKKGKELIVTGEDLLLNCTYFNLSPKIPLSEAAMTEHFKKATMNGVVTKVPMLTYGFSRENLGLVEKDIKKYLLTDPSNRFVISGIPPRLLDISFTYIKAKDDRVENALYIEEIEATEGRAEGQRRTSAIGDAHQGIKASLGKKLPSEEKDRMAHDYLTRQMSLDGKALTDIRVKGAEGMEKGFLNMIALAGKLFGAGFGKPPRGETDKERSPKEKLPEEMTDEELREVEDRLYTKHG